MHKVLTLIFAFIISLVYPSSTNAINEFATSYKSTYTIPQTGSSHVKHEVAITNQLAQIYVTSYTFAVTGANLSQIQVTDESGVVPFTLQSDANQSTINIEIAHPVIGKNQTKQLIISYTTNELVERIGDTLSINIPRLAKSNEAKEYQRIVKVQGVKALPSHLIPAPTETTTDSDWTTYLYNGHTTDSLSLLFGSVVHYRLNLKYQLKNPEMSPVDTELALPPDTPYQQITLGNFSPQPVSMRLDSDGNLLARYTLKPQEKIWVEAEIFATISPVPQFPDPSQNHNLLKSEPPLWDLRATPLLNLASQLKSPENIYSYLATNFHYNYDLALRGSDRQGSTQALSAPDQVVCTEYTDTFIALARAGGIASREVNGYAYSSNPSLRPLTGSVDVLHAWPEYFDQDKKLWVNVDPTWGSTTGGVDYFRKLDFSHIAFVRHGAEPDYPLPAGMYKNNADEKTIEVNVVDSIPDRYSQIETRGEQLYNSGNSLHHDTEYGFIPPYGSVKINQPTKTSLYDKIKSICVNLFSKFWGLLPGST